MDPINGDNEMKMDEEMDMGHDHMAHDNDMDMPKGHDVSHMRHESRSHILNQIPG